jgi:hypothetical protein
MVTGRTSQTDETGEHLVLAELYRRGVLGGQVARGARGVGRPGIGASSAAVDERHLRSLCGSLAANPTEVADVGQLTGQPAHEAPLALVDERGGGPTYS